MTHPFSGAATRGLCALVLAALLHAPSANAQATLLTGDHSVRGNLCVGASCNASVTFPDNADLLFQDTVLRTYFQDVQGFAGHAENDWEFVFNDIGQNGQNYFALRDVDANGQVFRIQSGAPTNAFFMAADGNIGLGTSIPQADLHIQGSGLTSAIQIQGAAEASISLNGINGGGTAFGFDMYADNFGWILENTQTDVFVLEMEKTAPGGSLRVNGTRFLVNALGLDLDFVVRGVGDPLLFADAGTTNVGIGTDLPAAPLHISRIDGSARVLVENTSGSPSAVREMFRMANNGGSYFTLDNTSAGTTWFFTHENSSPNRFIIADGVADGPEFTLTASGNVTIPGSFISGSTTLNVPDYVFEPGYELRPLSEVRSFIETNRHLPDVPSAADIATDGLDMTGMQMALLKKVEELTLYTLALEAARAEQAEELAQLRGMQNKLNQLDALTARIEALER